MNISYFPITSQCKFLYSQRAGTDQVNFTYCVLLWGFNSVTRLVRDLKVCFSCYESLFHLQVSVKRSVHLFWPTQIGAESTQASLTINGTSHCSLDILAITRAASTQRSLNQIFLCVEFHSYVLKARSPNSRKHILEKAKCSQICHY